MKGRATVALAAASLLLGALLVSGLLRGRDRPISGSLVSPQQFADLTRVEIIGPEPTIELAQGAIGWSTAREGARFPVRHDRVSLLIDAVRSASIERIATREKELWSRFGVGDDAAVLRFRSDSMELNLVVGGDPGQEHSFVRLPGDPAVYEIDSALHFFTRQKLSFWLLLRILPIDVEPSDVISLRASAVGALRAAGAPEAISLYRAIDEDRGDGWRAEQSGRDDSPLSLAPATGFEFVSYSADMVGASFWIGEWSALTPAGRVEIELADGRTFTLEIRGVGPFVVHPTGRGLPGEAFGELRYVIDTARLVRAMDVRLAAGVE